MSSEPNTTLLPELDSGQCSFCGLDSAPSRKLVRSPSGDALICRSCAETVIKVIDVSPGEDRFHMIIGACFFATLVVMGIALVWHFLFGAGNDYVIGGIAAGSLFVMGAIPAYYISFRGGRF